MPQLPRGIDLINDEEMIDAGLFLQAYIDANAEQKNWIVQLLQDPESKKAARMVNLAFHPDKNRMQTEKYTRLFNFINNKNDSFYRVLRVLRLLVISYETQGQDIQDRIRKVMLESPALTKYLRELQEKREQDEQKFQNEQAELDAVRERARREKQKPGDQEKRLSQHRGSQSPKAAPVPERKSSLDRDHGDSLKQERKPSIPNMFEQKRKSESERKSEEKPKYDDYTQNVAEKKKALNQILKNQIKQSYHSQKPTFAQKVWTYEIRKTQISFLDLFKHTLLNDSKLTTQQKAQLLNAAFNLVHHDLELEKSERWTKSESRLERAINEERKTLHQQFPALKEKLGDQKILIEYIKSRNLKPDPMERLLEKMLKEDQRLNKKYSSKPKN